ncbi:MAG: OB-fold nucleic acid binding domain-containing protein [Candidatus Thermoplasmatota archaeon]
MHQTKDQLYDLISDIYSKSDFEKIIHERSRECNGLLDLDTLSLLLVDEHGRNKQCFTKISDLKPDTECTVIGLVSQIHKQRRYTKKNGDEGRVLRIDIKDDTGVCSVILWNDDIERITHLDNGVRIKVVNGYVKHGLTGGLEIHIGRWSLLEIMDNTDNMKEKEIKDKSSKIEREHRVLNEMGKDITGVLTSKKPTHVYFMDNGDFGFVTTVSVKTEKGEVKCTVWGEKVKEMQSFSIGDRIRIINPCIRVQNKGYEYHINGGSRIQGF